MKNIIWRRFALYIITDFLKLCSEYENRPHVHIPVSDMLPNNPALDKALKEYKEYIDANASVLEDHLKYLNPFPTGPFTIKDFDKAVKQIKNHDRARMAKRK